MYEGKFPHKRYRLTLEFLKKHVATNASILDLGVENPFTEVMLKNGYKVNNTSGEDLDLDQSAITNSHCDVVTAFEIFEHLLNPFKVLQSIQANQLIISIPMRLWFASAYRSKTDMWDRHYHEFEDWQLDWLLEKTGWKIIDSKKWTNPTKKIGIRPILRWFTPRYYIIYAERH
ncbi:MAG: methyltransferase [Flavobacteriaceae bacterium]|nr:methyltransferase [Flavobacteriaceae bacterium]